MNRSDIPSVTNIVGRLGNGINTATAPLWQTETSQPKWRGKLVFLEMVMNIFGFSMVNWINYGLSFAGGSVAWRFPIAFQFMFIFVLFGTVPWLPESPRYSLFLSLPFFFFWLFQVSETINVLQTIYLLYGS